jgi:hypothetical protein
MVDDIQDQYGHRAELLGLVLNEYDPRGTTNRQVAGELADMHAADVPEYRMPIWPVRIPNLGVIEKSQVAEAPVSAYLEVGTSHEKKAATRVCQAAEACALLLLRSIGHPEYAAIADAWQAAWPQELRSGLDFAEVLS